YANAMGYIAILLSIGFTVYFFLKLQTARRELGMGD
ncbi:MAG: sugar ABC transporter permease, partial [Rhodobacteraceae bacterium]|nr:sugar ABC transporter permease [Paracoccaceae bacterium]